MLVKPNPDYVDQQTGNKHGELKGKNYQNSEMHRFAILNKDITQLHPILIYFLPLLSLMFTTINNTCYTHQIKHTYYTHQSYYT